jgi:hypothetical protein
MSSQFGNYLMTHGGLDTGSYSVKLWHDSLPQPGGKGTRVGELSISMGAKRNDVGGLYVAKEHRAMTGLMLGHAHNTMLEHTGRGLATSEELSGFSHRLVSRAVERGLLDRPSRMAEHRPEMSEESWVGPVNTLRGASQVDVSHEEIAAARHTVRQVLRKVEQ